MTENSIVERIKKLLALALDNSNEAESAAAMQKARELMTQHAIDEVHLRGAEAKASTAVYEFRNNRKFQSWMQLAFIGVSKLFDARVFIGVGREVDVAIFVCADYDVDLLRETNYHVIATILREAAIQCRGLAAANSFRAGAAQGFLDAAKAAQDEARAAEKADSGSEVTAIVSTRRNTVEAESKKMFPNSKSTAISVSASDAAAYYAGRALGNGLGKPQRKIE